MLCLNGFPLLCETEEPFRHDFYEFFITFFYNKVIKDGCSIKILTLLLLNVNELFLVIV